MLRAIEESKSLLTEDYIQFSHRFKAKSARVEREQTEMQEMFKDFVKKHEAHGRAVFVKTLSFYLDSLNKNDFRKILEALDEEIKALKSEMEERAVIEVEKLEKLQKFMSSPDKHLE